MKRNMRDRLKGAFDSGSRPQPQAPGVRGGGPLRDYLKRRQERAGARIEPVELPTGQARENDRGAFWVRELRYPLETTQHGRERLDCVRSIDWDVIAELGKDDGFAATELENCLFLDTETTGLSGGAGTTVFLTGMGWVDRDEVVLEQVFMRSFDEEEAGLLHVAERLAERSLPVTFVGKSFDRHRLAARMAVCRVESPVLQPLHLDLYYAARRAWRDQLPDVKLRTVEERRLGVFRRDDLPGSEAPRAWLDWLRDRTGPVDRVLEHNRVDVLSLMTLLGVLGRESLSDR